MIDFSHHHQTRSRHMAHQRGAALLLFMVVLVLVFSTYAVTTSRGINTRQTAEDKITAALAQAKEALLSFAVSNAYTNNPGLLGFLPCPDLDATTPEGTSKPNCGNAYVNARGYFPWRSLGLQPLKDSSGQCLWYAVSGDYKNGSPRSAMHNDDSNGVFQIYDETGNLVQGITEEQRVVAVVIAPGPVLPGQARGFNNNTLCGGDYNANNFLDVFNGVDNRNISPNVNTLDDFIAAQKSTQPNLNDRIITITQDEIFSRIRSTQAYARSMDETTEALARCLASYPTTAAGAGGGSPPPPCVICIACYSQCDATYDCNSLPPGPGRGVCAQNRNQCRQDCRNVSNCVNNASQCPSGGGGGVTDNRLPWPAPVDLSGSDYRVSNNYDDATVAGATSNLGRFPMIVDTSNTTSGNTGLDDLLERCNSITLGSGVVVDLTAASTDAHRQIWEHWKDHFFYAVSGAFEPSATTPTPADCAAVSADCITALGAADTYAGIVIFSAERLAAQNQRRLANIPTETINPAFADSKADISNYLEGNNAVPDSNGTGDYQTGTINDRAYCIQEDMSIVQCN